MMNYYTTIVFFEISALLIMQLAVSRSNTLNSGRKQMFHWFFAAIAFSAFCEWLANVLQDYGSALRTLHILIKAAELSVAPCIAFMFAFMLYNRHRRAVCIFLGVHALLEFASGIFGFIYYIDPVSHYHHAQFYWLYILVYMISACYLLYVVLLNIGKYQYSGGALIFILIVLWVMTGVVTHLVNGKLMIDYTVLSIASIMSYVFTLEMIQQTDELTGLLNRRGYENFIAHAEQRCAVIFFDVNNFKKANDTLGHAFGDKALRSIGIAIRQTYSRFGKCFRYGGDEFCVILTDRLDNIEELNHNFFMAIQKLRSTDNDLPTVSVGYAYYDPENNNIQDVISEADLMMYHYKHKD